MTVCLLCFQIFVGHVKGLGPLITVMVAGSHLEGAPVGHHGIDPNGVPSTREGIPNRPFGFDDGKTQIVHQPINDFQILSDLTARILFIGVSGVRLKEVDFSYSDERACLFGFVAEGVDHLVDFQR